MRETHRTAVIPKPTGMVEVAPSATRWGGKGQGPFVNRLHCKDLRRLGPTRAFVPPLHPSGVKFPPGYSSAGDPPPLPKKSPYHYRGANPHFISQALLEGCRHEYEDRNSKHTHSQEEPSARRQIGECPYAGFGLDATEPGTGSCIAMGIICSGMAIHTTLECTRLGDQ